MKKDKIIQIHFSGESAIFGLSENGNLYELNWEGIYEEQKNEKGEVVSRKRTGWKYEWLFRTGSPKTNEAERLRK